jgi:hypothetical protein
MFFYFCSPLIPLFINNLRFMVMLSMIHLLMNFQILNLILEFMSLVTLPPLLMLVCHCLLMVFLQRVGF